ALADPLGVEGEEVSAAGLQLRVGRTDEQRLSDEAGGVLCQRVETGVRMDVVVGDRLVDRAIGAAADDRGPLPLVVVPDSARVPPGIGGDGRHRGAGQPVFEHAGDRGLVEGAAGLPGLLRAQGFVNWHETILHSMQVFTKCKYAIVHYFTVCRIPMSRDPAARLT